MTEQGDWSVLQNSVEGFALQMSNKETMCSLQCNFLSENVHSIFS